MKFIKEVRLKNYSFKEFDAFGETLFSVIDKLELRSEEIEFNGLIITDEFSIQISSYAEFVKLIKDRNSFYRFEINMNDLTTKFKFCLYTFENVKMKTRMTIETDSAEKLARLENEILHILDKFQYRPIGRILELVSLPIAIFASPFLAILLIHDIANRDIIDVFQNDTFGIFLVLLFSVLIYLLLDLCAIVNKHKFKIKQQANVVDNFKKISFNFISNMKTEWKKSKYALLWSAIIALLMSKLFG